MSTIKIVVLASLAAPVATCVCAQGAVVGFHESFAQDAANWRGASSATTLGWSSLGGPGDAAYVTSIYNLVNTQAGGIPATIIRAATSAGSSGGAYQGNWAIEGVTGVSFWFRHDLSQSISLSLRIASPQNYPGASAFDGVLIPAST